MCVENEVKIAIVIPVYKTENGLFTLHQKISDVMNTSKYDWRLVLVDDFSQDDSWLVITQLCNDDPKVSGIHLSRNQGQHRAILVGLAAVEADCYVTMDDDLQHDPADVLTLLSALSVLDDVVYGRFPERAHPAWKRFGSAFNNLTSAVLIKKPAGLYLSPFRAIRRNVRDQIIAYRGESVYIDGLILRSTERTKEVSVKHSEREYGKSEYGLKKSMKLWFSMVFGFSLTPLRLVSYLGMILSFIGLMGLCYVLVMSLVTDTPPGWASLSVTIIFLGGFQLLSLGVIGEYVGRIASAVLFSSNAPIDAKLNLE